MEIMPSNISNSYSLFEENIFHSLSKCSVSSSSYLGIISAITGEDFNEFIHRTTIVLILNVSIDTAGFSK